MKKNYLPKIFYGKHLYLLIFALSLSFFAYSQQVSTYSGKVLDAENNKPIPGVSIALKGTSEGTQSDAQGNFSIKASQGGILVFRLIGYSDNQVTLGTVATINISLSTNAKTLTDVVVIGYGTQKKKDLTSAISVIDNKKIAARPVQTTEAILEGQVAGLTVTTDGGAPGSNGKVRIRGVGTFGNNDPLYVVDGIPVNNGLNFLNPNDIESITVLKDAAAAAIYGNRSANGVVLVTTKKGKLGKKEITFDARYGIAENGRIRPMADASQFWDYVNLKNQQGQFQKVHDLGYNTDWVKALSRRGANQDYNLGIRGGHEDHTYFTSFDYSKVDGTQLKSDNERLTARLNSSNNLFKWFKLSEDLSVISEKRHTNNLYGQARYVPSIVPIYKTPDQIAALSPDTRSLDQYFDVTQGIGFLNNPVAQLARANGTDYWLSIYGNAQAELDFGKMYKPLEGLKVTSTLGIERIDHDNHGFGPIYSLGLNDYSNKTNVGDSYSKYFHWTWNNFVTYNKTFNKHTIGITAGTVAEEETQTTLSGSGDTGLSNDPYLQVLDAQTLNYHAGGSEFQYKYLSYVGRVNYNYDDKYLLQASIRRDGTYRFAPGHRWGTFPSVGLGWNVSNEEFVKGLNLTWLSNFKLRGSLGQLGNERIQDNFPYLSQIAGTNNRGYVLGGVGGDNGSKTFVQGYGPTNVANPGLTWETTTSTNLGTDLGFFNDKLTASFDYFYRHTTNVLYQKSLPFYSGAPAGDGIDPVTQYVNGAEIKNHGFDFSVGYTDNFGKFGIHLDANLSKYHAFVSKLADGNPITVSDERIPTIIRMKVGDPLGAFYGFVVNGFYNNAAELLNSQGVPRQQQAQVGDFKFADLNGDGIIDGKDEKVLGDPAPKFSYAFHVNLNYAGFDLQTFWNGVYGNSIYSIGDIYLTGWDQGGAQNLWADVVANSWTPTHTNALYPEVSANGTKRNYQQAPVSSSIQKGSFLRLKNLQVGYTIPGTAIKGLGMSNMRVYFSGENLFVITKYKGDDPEIAAGARLNSNLGGQGSSPSYVQGLDYGDRYPIQKTYTFGVSIKF